MTLHNEKHVLLADYTPLYEDDEGITPLRVAEIRASTRRVSVLRYEAQMSACSAGEIARLPVDEIMRRLELDAVQAEDLKNLAAEFLERMEHA